MNRRPSARSNHTIWSGSQSEWVVFRLACDNSAGCTASAFAENAIEDKNRHSVLMSFDYIPHLCNSSAGWMTGR